MPGVLTGFTVAVTADRRRDELATSLEHHGARVVLAPALRIVPLADDTRLRAATHMLLERPPDVVVANTGIGMRGWLDAAEGWGLGDALRAKLAGAYLVARGPKARGALRAAGLTESWSPDSDSNVDVLEHLVRAKAVVGVGAAGRGRRRGEGPLTGRRIAVQLHDEPQEEVCGALVAACAEAAERPG